MLDTRTSHTTTSAPTTQLSSAQVSPSQVSSAQHNPNHNEAQTPRSVDAVYRPPGVHWVGDGFRVHGYFNSIPDAARRLSPFLLLDYHPAHNYEPTERPRGVGVHPHRGFETVTLAFQGAVAHHDSAGNGGVIGPGGVQWMTAASGILHKEYHEAEYARRGGAFQMAQLWVNLPKAHKMDPPRYQGLTAAEMGQVTLPDEAGQVRVVAGQFQDVRGPAKTFSPIELYHVQLKAGHSIEFPLPQDHNAAVLMMDGTLSIGAESVANQHDFVIFKRDGNTLRVTAQSDAEWLVMSGQPIDEPVVQYGPFVMNTEQEIQQAFQDYNHGKFGRLV